MQDMLVPILGENGAIIAQYVITLAVILGLIVLVVWGLRRFGAGGIRPAVRGRLPRLAVVDALPIDNKRRLVLVRRDNVEHLVLIGGPTDVVVEPSIVRQRVTQRPGQATAARPPQAGVATAAPQPQPAPVGEAAPRELAASPAFETSDATTSENAIPFPPRRSTLRASDRLGLSRRETTRSATAAAAAAAIEPLSETVAVRRTSIIAEDEPEAVIAEPATTRLTPPVRPAGEEAEDERVPGYPLEARDEDDQESVSAFAPPEVEHHPAAGRGAGPSGPGEAMEFPAAPPTAAMEPPEGAARPAEVSDLEKEMARLLDEISTSRRE
jgi:hypothetical protein